MEGFRFDGADHISVERNVLEAFDVLECSLGDADDFVILQVQRFQMRQVGKCLRFDSVDEIKAQRQVGQVGRVVVVEHMRWYFFYRVVLQVDGADFFHRVKEIGWDAADSVVAQIDRLEGNEFFERVGRQGPGREPIGHVEVSQ